jgi:ZIP family zinc transporter
MILLIALGAFAATLIGGLFALKLRDRLHLVLGFSAGAILGVAFFDLLPEALELAGTSYEGKTVTAVVALGFIIYLVIDRLVLSHSHDDEHHHDGLHAERGILGAGSLSFHSFLDGMAIGLAFQVSTAVGAVVTTAVLLHDFSDGINTVNLILKNGGERKKAFRWLLIDAAAPVLGIIAASFFELPSADLGIVLALFCGFFLYIGASELLPESYHGHPTILTTVTTLLGVGILYAAINLAGI